MYVPLRELQSRYQRYVLRHGTNLSCENILNNVTEIADLTYNDRRQKDWYGIFLAANLDANTGLYQLP